MNKATWIEFREGYQECWSLWTEFRSVVKWNVRSTVRSYYHEYKTVVDLTVHQQYVFGAVLTEVQKKRMNCDLLQKMNEYKAKIAEYANTPTAVPCTQPIPYAKDSGPIYIDDFSYDETVSLGCTTTVGNNKKKNNMYYDYRDNLKPEQLHLLNRASRVESKLTGDAYTKFMQRPDAPKTAQELVDFIKAGNIRVVQKGEDDYNRFGGLTSNIIFSADWKADQAGYDAAMASIKAEYTKAKDMIIVGEPKDGLAALQAFEALSV
jgi:hypothetical protein